MIRCLCTLLMLVHSATAFCAEPLRVSVAISLKEALAEIAPAYEAATGQAVELSFGASGQLASQVRSGAPIDVFISAAQKQIDELVNAGLVDRGESTAIAGNALVLIAPATSSAAPDSFAALAVLKGRLAMGEPASVPAGGYALQTLRSLKLDERLKDAIVFGANVRQVLAYVERGEVAAGMVYATDARQSGDKVRVIATADPSWHDPILYPAVVIQSSKQPDAARRFIAFLQTEPARAALTSRGFTVPSTPATQPAK